MERVTREVRRLSDDLFRATGVQQTALALRATPGSQWDVPPPPPPSPPPPSPARRGSGGGGSGQMHSWSASTSATNADHQAQAAFGAQVGGGGWEAATLAGGGALAAAAAAAAVGGAGLARGSALDRAHGTGLPITKAKEDGGVCVCGRKRAWSASETCEICSTWSITTYSAPSETATASNTISTRSRDTRRLQIATRAAATRTTTGTARRVGDRRASDPLTGRTTDRGLDPATTDCFESVAAGIGRPPRAIDPASSPGPRRRRRDASVSTRTMQWTTRVLMPLLLPLTVQQTTHWREEEGALPDNPSPQENNPNDADTLPQDEDDDVEALPRDVQLVT